MRSGNMLVDRHDDEDVPEEMDYCYECKSSPCMCEEIAQQKEEEADSYRMSFEDFLAQKWHDMVNCTENDCMDDDQPDAVEAWIGDLDADDLMKLAEEYGKKCFKDGRLLK